METTHSEGAEPRRQADLRASVGAVTAHSHLQGALGKDFGGQYAFHA